MIILGAGLSGLLCGVLNPLSRIYEARKSQPKNHQSLLRLKSPEIGRLTGIPLRKVVVQKGVWSEGKEQSINIRLAHQYSWKVMQQFTARSIINLEPEIRYIPPDNFVDQLKDRTTSITYGKSAVVIDKDEICFEDGSGTVRTGTPVVSTLPMPVLQEIITGEESDMIFPSNKIIINRFHIKGSDSYCTIYYPDMDFPVYRATMNGNTLIVESNDDISSNEMEEVLASFGIPDWAAEIAIHDHMQYYGKILPISATYRKKFIYETTTKYNIFALGRFATWRPKVCLDDVLEDTFQIRRMITEGNYAIAKHAQEE